MHFEIPNYQSKIFNLNDNIKGGTLLNDVVDNKYNKNTDTINIDNSSRLTNLAIPIGLNVSRNNNEHVGGVNFKNIKTTTDIISDNTFDKLFNLISINPTKKNKTKKNNNKHKLFKNY